MEYLYVEVVVQSYPALIFVNEPWLKRRQNEVRQLAKGEGSERDPRGIREGYGRDLSHRAMVLAWLLEIQDGDLSAVSDCL